MYRHQAFRVGAPAWGVQFHPEVSLPTFRGWAEDLPEVDTARVTAELAERDDDVASAGAVLAHRFTRSGGLARAGRFAPWTRPGGRRAGWGGWPGPDSPTLPRRPGSCDRAGLADVALDDTLLAAVGRSADPDRALVTLGRLLDAVDDRTELVAALCRRRTSAGATCGRTGSVHGTGRPSGSPSGAVARPAGART